MRRILAILTLTTAVAGVTLTSAPISASASTGTTYYVDCKAPAGGDGLSTAKPWNTVDAINSHTAFLSGDRILLRRGSVCTGQIEPSGSGEPGHPIVLGAWGTGSKPVINGRGTANGTGAIELLNQHDWTLQDLHVTNSDGKRDTSTYRSGVLLRNGGGGSLANLMVQRLTVDTVTSNPVYSTRASSPRDFGGISALTYGRVSGDRFVNLRILDNDVSHVGRTGISASNEEYPRSSSSGVLISGNKVSYARGDSIILNGAHNSRIVNNVSANGARFWPCSTCGKITPASANAAIWTANSDHVTIEHNEAYGERALGGDGEGLDIDANVKSVVVQYNYVHDNDGGGILFCGSSDATVRFNIFENNKKSAIAFIGSMPAQRSQIYNNTIYQSKKSKAGIVRYFDGGYGNAIKYYNNVVFNYAKGYYMWPTKPWKASIKVVPLWSRSNTLVGAVGSAEPRGQGTTKRNPGLKRPGSGGTGMNTLGGYKPKHPSTFARGVAIPSSVKTDFFGKRINPKHPPRGAAG